MRGDTDPGADTDTDAGFGALVSPHTPVYCPVRCLHAVCCTINSKCTLNNMVTVLWAFVLSIALSSIFGIESRQHYHKHVLNFLHGGWMKNQQISPSCFNYMYIDN